MTGLLLVALLAQNFEQRGFIENSTLGYPQTAPNDSGQIVDEILFRWEAFYKVTPWLKLSGAFDAETDSHHQVSRDFRFDADDRSIQRPAFSFRRYSATIHKGRVTAELGRQFIRWGKADILNPTDRFAPKDYLGNVVNQDFLGVVAARVTVDFGNDSLDLVWQPWFTPSRTPLLNQRWTAVPQEARESRFRIWARDIQADRNTERDGIISGRATSIPCASSTASTTCPCSTRSSIR